MTTSAPGPDGRLRCKWALAVADMPEYLAYHDAEWGHEPADDQQWFEALTLESFQSGLSWRTILAKRGNFRQAFAHFDFSRIAGFGEADIERLLQDEGIVRHRGKIEATINNAERALEMVRGEGSLGAFFRRHAIGPADDPQAVAKSLARELKKRGWKFVGPTTVYAFMQATGLVNDHAVDCVFHGGG